jgi:hypothetical protein
MTAKPQQSQVVRVNFKDFVPEFMIEENFDAMYWNQKFYLCLIETHKNAPRMYLEKSKTEQNIIRAFYDEESADIYCQMVSSKEKIGNGMVKKWEIKFVELIEYIKKVSNKYKEDKKGPIKLVSSGFYDGKVVELDVMWTDNQNFIN